MSIQALLARVSPVGRVLPLGLAGVLAVAALPALAGGWSAYNSAFPTMPCSDGWAGCIVGTTVVGPGMVKDSAGRPIPSDARVGWFDLQATASLSPFVTLSPYSGPLGGQVAEAAPPPVEAPPVELASVERVEVEAPPPPTTAQPVSAQRTPPSTTTAPSSFPQTTSTPPPTTQGRSLGQPATTTTPPPTTTAKTTAPPPTTTPPPTTQGRSLGQPATTTTTPPTTTPPPTSTAKATAPAVVPPPTAAAAGDDSCADLVKLEPQAMLGQLRTGQAKCIEGRIQTEGAQTMKDKLSRVLIANAEGKGDKAEWERLVKRHLEDIDRSDPDMCFKYATQLSRGGTGRANGVIRWADYGLENKQRWTGTTYTKRVYDLLRMKTEAANKLWADAEEVYATKEHTEENEVKAAKWRGTTKDFAREWLDYAKASGQDTKNAMSICVSAAGNKSFCEG